MIELFIEGGALFMGILTLILFTVLALAVKAIIHLSQNKSSAVQSLLPYIKNVGLFALVTGILGQLIGLYQAFLGIQQMGEVSPAMLAGGLKVSMITTMYGFVICLIAFIIWFAISALNRKSSVNTA